MIDLLIVTGGSKGIGKNIVLNSSKCVKKVLAIGSSDLINDVSDRKKHIYTIKRDISRIDKDFDELSDFLKKHNPSSIGIALCAAKLGNFGGIADADFMDWENLYRTNVLGNLSVLNNILKFANINTFIRVIFFGGGGSGYGYPDFSGYSLSKVAVVRAVENIGIEFKKDYKNASIVALAPGAVNTDMLAIVESHGGEVSLVKFTDKGEAILQFGGGCQGCGMVDITLKDGIEKTLLEQIPELTSVMDSTDHSIDDNAFYKS